MSMTWGTPSLLRPGSGGFLRLLSGALSCDAPVDVPRDRSQPSLRVDRVKISGKAAEVRERRQAPRGLRRAPTAGPGRSPYTSGTFTDSPSACRAPARRAPGPAHAGNASPLPKFRGLRGEPPSSGRLPAFGCWPALGAIGHGPVGRHRRRSDRVVDRGVFRRARWLRRRSSGRLGEFDDFGNCRGAGSSTIDHPVGPDPRRSDAGVGVGNGVCGSSWGGFHRHRESR